MDARTWVEKPVVEPVEAEYDSRPIHRNPVVGLPQLEPALAVFAEPVVETAEPAAEPEPEPEVVEELEVEAEVEAEEEPEVVVETALPPPAKPQAVEQTTWVEREDFRQRYLRTFDEVRRKAGSN
ncbi:hypothetical protein Lesp01_84070 [Lentzea sp. NBRC 102530]|nr:hypothetical protein Lesp01_84070 [Lentzea sp. NBRC 102530]